MIPIKVYLSVIAAFCLMNSRTCQSQPVMISTPQRIEVQSGQNTMLECVIQNLGNRKVIWTFVDHNIVIAEGRTIMVQTATKKYSIEHPQESKEKESNTTLSEDSINAMWSLIINNVQLTDVGHYKCHVDDVLNASVTHQVVIAGPMPTLPPSRNVSDEFNVTDCCIREQVSSACMPVCHPRAIQNPLSFNISVCAIDFLKILKCGSDGKNHAGCCKRRAVPDMCLDYCMGQIPADVTAEHDKCLNDVMDIIACYEDGQGYLPGPPTRVAAVQLPVNSMFAIQVLWAPPIDNPQMVTGYRVLYKLTSDSTFRSSDILLADQSYRYVITNAQVEKTYVIYVISVGANGASQPSPMYYLTIMPNRTSQQGLIRDCCIEKGVSDDCLEPLCGTNRIFNMDPTIIFQCYSQLNASVQCLTGQRNHRPCCERVGIPQNCLTFCSGQVPDLLGQDMDETWNYTSCILRLQTIDACVQEGLATIPGPPTNISLSVGVDTVSVTWVPASGATATKYTVLYQERDSNNGQMNKVDVFGTSAVIAGLLPGTHYQIQVVASNDNGSSLPSTKIIFLTYERTFTTAAPVPTPPGQQPYYNETACCIEKNVTSKCMPLCSYSYLTSPSGLDWGLGVQCVDDLGKVIACAADERDHTDCCKESNVPESCLYFCRFTHGTNLTVADILCAEHTPLIASCYREGVVSLPKRPQNVTVVRVTAHTAMLSWKQPDTSQVPVASYEVLYTTDVTKKWMSSSTSVTTYIINNLKPSTYYYVQVVSVNSNGTSVASPLTGFSTLDYVDDSASNSTSNVACTYTVYKDTSVIYDGMVSASNTNTMEECRQVCEDSGIRFDPCVAFHYGRTLGGECALYYDREGLQRRVNKTGVDLYVKTCSQSPSINTTIDWTAIWHNRSDCCDKNNVSDTCLPSCKSGDLTNPYICENDLNVLIACASDGKNHTNCCQRNRVPQACLPLCAGQPMEKNAITSLCLSFAGILIDCFTEGKGKLPSPPTSFQVSSVASNYITLSWERPVSNCDANCSYKVMVIKKDGVEFQNSTIDMMWKLRNLKPGTKYTVSVIAINMYGTSLPALVQEVTTLPSTAVDIVIKQSPSHPEVTGNVNLICEVYGPSHYVVSWYFNNKIIHQNRHLDMRSLVEEQEGTYICSATDFERTFNKSYFLQLKYKPRVVNPTGDSQIVNSNKIGTLSCQFYGLPDKITWQKDGKNVKDLSDSFRSYASLKPISGTAIIKSVLSIYYVTDKSVGDYTCIGENKFGNSTGHMKLTNLYPTIPPPTVPVPSVRNVTECCKMNNLPDACLEICHYNIDISLVLQNPTKYDSCLSHLQIYISCATDGKDHTKCCTKRGVTDRCKPFCAGQYPDIRDDNDLLFCVTDLPTILNCVQEGVPHLPSPPQNMNYRIDTDAVIQLFWDPPKDNAVNLTHYVLYIFKTGFPKDTRTLSSTTRSYEITNGKDGDSFAFYVVAENALGGSQPSNMKNLTFKDVKPAQVKGLYVKIDGNKAELHWKSPRNLAMIQSYTVMYGPNGSPKTSVKANKTVTSVVLPNLQPNTLYNFDVVTVGYARSSGAAPLTSDSMGRTAQTGQNENYNKPTGADERKGSGSSVGLGLGLTALFLVLAGAAVATFLYCRRSRKRSPSQAVSFENPQYGSRVQISGLPESNYDNSSQDESFGYAPLREETEIEHSSPKAYEAAKLDVSHS